MLGSHTYMLVLSAGLLEEALAAAAMPPPAIVAQEAAPVEVADAIKWDASTRCYAPDMYRAETVGSSSDIWHPIFALHADKLSVKPQACEM